MEARSDRGQEEGTGVLSVCRSSMWSDTVFIQIPTQFSKSFLFLCEIVELLSFAGTHTAVQQCRES